MPDPHKLQRLKQAGYLVRRVCGNCSSGCFAPGLDWGSCRLFTYTHAKHGPRQLSINRAGSCPSHSLNSKKADDMERSGFMEFIEEEPFQDDLDHGVGMLSH